MSDKSLAGHNRGASFYGSYDAGEVTVSADATVVEPSEQVQQLLLYPTTACKVKIGASTKEIFVPKDTWTPISVVTEEFSVVAIEGTGTLHWQGWIL